MDLNNENEQLSQKISNFLNAHGKIILLSVVAVLFIGVVIFLSMYFKEKAQKDAIAGIERIVYELDEFKTKFNAEAEKNKVEAKDTEEDSDAKSEEEVEKKEAPEVIEKEDLAIKDLQEFSAKGYAGFRANTVIAEIYFARKNYKEALKFYELAAEADTSHYIAGIAFFNVAACADELGDLEKAKNFYKKASEVESFPLIPRALFNLARVNESLGNKEDAIAVYNKLLETYPRNEWALLGKSRIIELQK